MRRSAFVCVLAVAFAIGGMAYAQQDCITYDFEGPGLPPGFGGEWVRINQSSGTFIAQPPGGWAVYLRTDSPQFCEPPNDELSSIINLEFPASYVGFSYVSCFDVTVEAYDGPDGTGNLLDSVVQPWTDTGEPFGNWESAAVTADECEIRSIKIIGVRKIDNVELCCVPVDEPGECRVTGGGNDTDPWDGSMAEGEMRRNGHRYDRYTFGGQAGAPTAAQPQPYGEWTHHQQRGPSGRFVFHAGTASAPPGTEIDLIVCSDPGFCNPARPAPFKQIDFEGVGSFRNVGNNVPDAIADATVEDVSLHWFHVHIEDAGEGGGTNSSQNLPEDQCPAGGNAGTALDCDCADFYTIRIHATDDPASDVIYEIDGYITGGNFQIHPPVGG